MQIWVNLLLFCNISFYINFTNNYDCVLIKQNGKLIEKRYLDSFDKTVSVVLIDSIKMIPTDSFYLTYNYIKYNLEKIEAFNYLDNAYCLDPNSFLGNYLYSIYSQDNNCINQINAKSKILVEEEFSNLCNIINSVLSDGEPVLNHCRKNEKLGTLYFKFDNLHSRFNKLSLILQTYFYNQELIMFKYGINGNYLIEEEYLFSNGSLFKKYEWLEGNLNRVFIEIKLNDGYSKNIIQEFCFLR